MKKYFTKKSPSSTILRLIVIEIVFSLMLFLLNKDLASISITMWILWTVFLIFILYGIINAFQNKPTLVIDETGLIDNSSMNSSGRIEWKDIKNIEIRNGVNMRFLCIDLYDEEKTLSNFNAIKKLLMKSNKKKLKTICAIPEISLNDNLEEILRELNTFMTNK